MIHRYAVPLVLLLTTGCVVWMREPDAYRAEIVERVETRDETVQACYDALLVRRQSEIEAEERASQGPYADIGPVVSARVNELQGNVVATVTVGADTGKMTMAVDAAGTSAPPEVAQCVLDSMDALSIAPPDKREGTVTLAFVLQVGQRPAQP